MSRKRSKGKGAGYLCWKCGSSMSKPDLMCKRCRKTRPAAVKAQLATLRKAYGGRVSPVAAPAARTIVKSAPRRALTAEDVRRERLQRDMTSPDPVRVNVAWYELHPEITPPWSSS